MNDKIFQKIREFVADQGGIPEEKLTRETKISTGIQIDGGDITDFMENVEKYFDIDATGFDYDKYFYYGGCYLFDKLKSILFGTEIEEMRDLTLGDIEKWVERGYWLDES